MKKLLPILTLALLLLCGCTNQATGEAQSEVPENPTNAKEVAPDYTYLRNDVDGLNFVYEEDEDLYGLYVSGISQEQYQEYMDKLTQAGFDDIIGEHDGNVVLKHNSGLYGAVVMYDDVDMTVGITKYDNLDALY